MNREITQIKSIIVLLGILYFPGQSVFSQHTSKNNYTGLWETPASWSPAWPTPQTFINQNNITINGYITVNDSLSFSGPSDLIINDTLVIIGDLSLNNNCDLIINNDGILIVMGNLHMHNYADIKANGYLIIAGNIDKHGPTDEGSLTSNDNPVKIFIGGTISPGNLTSNQWDYPALNCGVVAAARYPDSNCTYGNMTDIKSDPIYSFFQSTCANATPTITAGGPVTFCTGERVHLASSTGKTYLWSTGATTRHIDVTQTGNYSVKVTYASGCQSLSSAATVVTVKPLPSTPAINAGGPTTLCGEGSVTLTSSPGITYLWSTGAVTASINVNTAGSYTVQITDANGCQSPKSEETKVVYSEKPDANAGPDQDLSFVFETEMHAELSSSETGEWSLISGTGHISDINSPRTRITGLSTGENIFLWKVRNANCEASAEVIVTVNDLFVPSVITPDGDGKNDYFKISETTGRIGLIIFNKWGNEEYTNDNYINDWDGRNNKGAELPGDTYFYILSFDNDIVKRGSVLIKR